MDYETKILIINNNIMDSMCRICFSEDISLRVVVGTYLEEIYQSLTLMPFETIDSRPTQICYVCCARLNNCYLLREDCLRSEKQFIDMGAPSQLVVAHSACRLSVSEITLLSMGHVAQCDTGQEVKLEPLEACFDVEVKVEHEEDILEVEYITDLNSVCDIPLECVEITNQQTECEYTGILSTKNGQQQKMRKSNNRTSSKTKKNKQKISILKMNDDNFSVKNENQIKCNEYKENNIMVDHSYASTETVKKNNSNSRPHRCSVCQKCFKMKVHLNYHMRNHTGDRRYPCNVCEKSFVLKNDLAKHSRTHSGEKPYQCNVCDKCFTQRCTLIVHLRLHTGEKPFKCKVCRKSFTDNSTYITHGRIHTNEKPHECDVCKLGFRRPYHLKRHLWAKHKDLTAAQ